MIFPKPNHLLFLIGLLLGSRSLADPVAEINALLEPIREKHHLPALAAVVFDRNGAIAQGAAGKRKAGDEAAVTPGDLWHLGSNTKAMTATLAGGFVAEGRLKWDDTVARHFPEFADRIHPELRGVTVSQLLAHRSGLTANLAWSDFPTRDLPKARQEAARQLLTAAPASAVGSYTYSNAGYVVVGAILEKLSGKPWETLMKERLFLPLGMKTAGFGGTGTVGKTDQPWPHRADGRALETNGPATDNAPVLGPAGTVHSSLEDWTKYLADQLRGASGGKALLPPEIYQAIQVPHPAGADYGLGWRIVERPWAGGKTLTHNGTNTMNFSVCWLSVPKHFGVAACSNQGGDAATKGTDEAVAALIGWYQQRTPEKRRGGP